MKILPYRSLVLMFSILLIHSSCQRDVDTMPNNDPAPSSVRMPFNQKLFILNSSQKGSEIYKIDYDFQGLEDDAYLTKLRLTKNGRPFRIPRGGHMCISPNNDFITVVVSRLKKIYLVNIASLEVKVIHLFGYFPNKKCADMRRNLKKFKFRGKITQVDVDQDGYLFLAGKSGFYKVITDWGNVENSNGDIWNDEDPELDGTRFAGQTWAHAVKFEFSGNLAVEGAEDEVFFEQETYFEENTISTLNTVKFLGGDILFTQNSLETDGFEEQRLISFSQWNGGSAIYLNNLDWNWDDQKVTFNAGTLYTGLNNKITEKSGGRVTGAALTGDNMVFTSHHYSEYLQLRTLNGQIIKDDVRMILLDRNGNEKGALYHNWGDMASTQSFDKNSQNTQDIILDNRSIEGEYFGDWFRGNLEGYQLAEMKLYRPKDFNYGLKDLSHDNYNVSKESRRNSANADIADFRKNANKFVALGGNGGYTLLQLPNKVTVTDETTLQVVETTWGKQPYYEVWEDAWSAYEEKAAVYVHRSYTGRYYYDGLEEDSEWVKIGDAYIANNEFHLSSNTDLAEGTEISWVKIVDNGSTSGDGFDVNFVATYEKPIVKEALSDREILMLFYNSTGGDNWRHNTNWGTDKPLSEWYGIGTNEEGRVNVIELIDLNVNGDFVEELADLQYLRKMVIPFNSFTGTLPARLTELESLELIYIVGNKTPFLVPEEFNDSPIMLYK
ncbi:hypothetical protein [Flammeovirga sp. SubArs3]|uniref:hypothetical protein n=1 Tax=Flammeovirga sp. SubArs3 TaxID=2995316 RepID=UPI00248BA4EF|nr:hypothetical protein [Flammeovirga sp. SubArs3]